MSKKKHFLDNKKWQHIAFVYENNKSTLYVDGKICKKPLGMSAEFWSKPNMIDQLIISKLPNKKEAQP